jgi:hypothetical protein
LKIPVTINPITDHKTYEVNGHLVYRNSLGNWTCKVDLSDQELRGFRRYEKAVIKNPAFKKHTKATYKG